MKPIMKKIMLCSIAAFSFVTIQAFAKANDSASLPPLETKCPRVYAIKTIGLNAYRFNGPDEKNYWQFYTISNYGTENHWKFSISVDNVYSRLVAFEKANSVLWTLSGEAITIINKTCWYATALQNTYAVAERLN